MAASAARNRTHAAPASPPAMAAAGGGSSVHARTFSPDRRVTVSNVKTADMAATPNTSHTLYVEFGRQLREARDDAGLTQGQLADAVGLSRTSITNIEAGTQPVALHMLFALSRAVDK